MEKEELKETKPENKFVDKSGDVYGEVVDGKITVKKSIEKFKALGICNKDAEYMARDALREKRRRGIKR
jgi:hypothetical protein